MLTIKRVLFPTDRSDGSKRAFPQAAFLADWHDATLHVVNVTGRHQHNYREMKEHFPIPADTLAGWLRTAAGPDDDSDGPGRDALPPIEQTQIESATPAEALITYMEEAPIDLVVMGTHGRRGVDRMLFGSVTEEVVRRGPCPVLTIRHDAEVAPKQAVRRVLVPVDFSDASREAVQYAKEIALTYGAEIDLLHVVEEPLYASTYGLDPVHFPTDEVVDRVETQLGNLARDAIGYEHVMVEAAVGHPPTQIIDYVDSNEIDLVVIATHGRTGLDRMLIGSVAERVLRQSPTPVFVVKPGRRSLLPASSGREAANVG